MRVVHDLIFPAEFEEERKNHIWVAPNNLTFEQAIYGGILRKTPRDRNFSETDIPSGIELALRQSCFKGIPAQHNPLNYSPSTIREDSIIVEFFSPLRDVMNIKKEPEFGTVFLSDPPERTPQGIEIGVYGFGFTHGVEFFKLMRDHTTTSLLYRTYRESQMPNGKRLILKQLNK